jgi:hypothetical protein
LVRLAAPIRSEAVDIMAGYTSEEIAAARAFLANKIQLSRGQTR